MKPKTQTQQVKHSEGSQPCGTSQFGQNDTTTAENQEIKSLRKDAPANVDALDKYESSPDLSSQLNPSGCKIDGCGITYSNEDIQGNFTKHRFPLCPICSAKRLATAKALYNEKKKILEFLEKIFDKFNWSNYENSLVREEIDILESEIKQIETECSEVLDASK